MICKYYGKKNQNNDIIFYTSPEGNINIGAIYNNETFWLSQKRKAELFGCSPGNISLHIKNIFKDKELDPNSVAEEISATAADGKNYKTRFYNLDAIIAAGYRVKGLENKFVYNNSFNNNGPENKGNLVFNQDNFEG